MGTIDELLADVEQMDLMAEMPQLILATSYEITSLTQLQLYNGELATGEKIGPKYGNKFYATQKAALNPLPGYGTPDLFLKGNLFKAMGVSVSGDEFDIESTIDYAQKLELQYGDQLFKLSDKSITTYAQGVLFDAVKAYITGKTGLTFI